MRIEASDIDALIEIVTWLKAAADMPDYCESKIRFLALAGHARKIYILLLNASEHGQTELKHLCQTGVPENSKVAKAIYALCPHMGQKSSSQPTEQENKS